MSVRTLENLGLEENVNYEDERFCALVRNSDGISASWRRIHHTSGKSMTLSNGDTVFADDERLLRTRYNPTSGPMAYFE